jgi:hypothetical protein
MGIPAPIGVAGSGLPPAGSQANAYVAGVFTAIGPGIPFAFRGLVNAALWASVNTTLTTTANNLSATVGSATGLAVGANINGANVPRGTTIKTLVGTTVGLGLPTQTYWGYPVAGSTSLPLNAGSLSSLDFLVGATVTGTGVPSGTTVVAVNNTLDVVILSNAITSAPAVNNPVPFQFALGAAAVAAGADTAARFTGAGVSYVASVQLEWSFDGGAEWIVANAGGLGVLAIYNAGTPVRLAFSEGERQVLYRWNCTAYTSGTINYRISETGGAAESLGVLSI